MIQPRGEVFDIGYQRYQGPREGRWRSRISVFENGLRTILGIGRGGRAKVLPVGLFLSAITPALVFVLIIAASGQESVVPGPVDYYVIVAVVLTLFGAIMAPELLIPDRRDRVINLYLVRPLTVTDYLVARIAAFFVVALALVYSGQIVLLVGTLLSVAEPVDYLRDHWLDIPRFLASGALIALFITVAPMAVAGFVSRRAFAAAFVIGLWIISAGVVGALVAPNCPESEASQGFGPLQPQQCEPVTGENARWVALLDLGTVPLHLNHMIFDEDPAQAGNPSITEASKLPAIVPIAWYVLAIIVPGVLLWSRYRRLTI
jgi:ABC-2 type transport system permease protein